MKIICQIGVIFAVCWFSQLIEAALPVPFPASVIGMLLLLALLATGLLKIEHIREKADFLLANMASTRRWPSVSAQRPPAWSAPSATPLRWHGTGVIWRPCKSISAIR